MKVTKTMFVTALIAGNLFASGPGLRAADTNAPPATPPAGTPPPAGPRGPGGGQAYIEHMAVQLGLTDEQKPKFQSIMETQRQKMRELQQDPNFRTLSQEDQRAKMKAIHEEMVAQMKALLTPEQFEKWQKMPQAGTRGRRMGPPPGGGNPSGGSSSAGTNAPAGHNE